MADGAQTIRLHCPEKLVPLLSKPKRTKIAVGGRGGAKSVTFADAFLVYTGSGEKVLCGREFHNSLDDSVHSLLTRRIGDIGMSGFDVQASTITHKSGGQVVYRGLSRNTQSIKSMYGLRRVWIEEGQTLSQDTIDVLFPTIREAGSEIWISMNRGSSADPVSQSFLVPHEDDLRANGYYEDDDLLIIDINYWDNPWFPDVLEQQRQLDEKRMPRARYDHIWRGYYADSIDDAIIQPEWFDACVDAHQRLGFEGLGTGVVSFDPSDRGQDPKGLVYRHGPLVLDAVERKEGDVNEACSWSLQYARQRPCEIYIWDADGLGTALRQQVHQALSGTSIEIYPFQGGNQAERPDDIYEAVDTQTDQRPNKQVFYNRRAQHFWLLRDRMFRTYRAVAHGEYYDPDTLLAISSECTSLSRLRAEVCRVPQKYNAANRLQVMTKAEMRSKNIPSPNLADSLMMSMAAQWIRPFSKLRRARRRPAPNWRS